MSPREHKTRWRRWFGSTGKPPQFGLVLYLMCGGAVGAALGAVFNPQEGAILSGLTGALIAAAGSRGPSRIALRVAGFASVIAVAFVLVGFLVAGHPWWAAAAVAAVAIITSALAGAGPVGSALSQLGLWIYFIAVVSVTTTGLSDDVSLASGALRIVLGVAAGLAVTAVGAALRDRRDPEAAANAARLPSPWPALWATLRSFDENARDGVRRAIPLAIGLYLYERSGSEDALWVFLAAFVVLMPAGKSPLGVALARVVSTLVGVVLLGLLALVLPESVGLVFSLVALLLGVAYSPKYPLVAGGLTAMGAILLVGAPTDEIGTWALHRLLDTALGCGLALGSMYLLWPRDKPDVDDAAGGEPSAETAGSAA